MCGEIRGGRYDAPMTSLSDPSRVSRRDRRKAQKAIDAGYAAGRLTAADRTLRTLRIEAAQTRGDLAMITRDLASPTTPATAPATVQQGPPGPPGPPGQPAPTPQPPATPPTPSLGSAIDPTLLEAMRVKPTHRSTSSTASSSMGSSSRIVSVSPNARKVLIVIALVVAGLIGLCALGIVGVVVSAINGANDGPPATATSTRRSTHWSDSGPQATTAKG